MSDVDDLTAWLTAKLDEDERVAKAAVAGPWTYNPGKQWHDGHDFDTLTNPQEYVAYGGPSPFTGCVCVTGPANDRQSMADAEHVATFDPTRALAEVAAKRHRLARHAPDRDSIHGAFCRWCSVPQGGAWQEWPCPDIRADAAVYADRPGYRQEWRPE